MHVCHCSVHRGLIGKQEDVYIQRFSDISVINCKTVFDFVTKPGAPTGIDDKRCATQLGHHSRMPETDGRLFDGDRRS